MSANSKKIVISIIALGLVIIALLGVFDDIGKRYTDESFNRALLTFGVARGLNAVISVAQGTELAMEPAGIGVVFTPGQILDPVNDLIERFSWVMLASTTSLGVQGLLLKIFSSTGFSILVGVMVILALALLWWQKPSPAILKTILYRIAGFLLILRFLIPVMAITSEGFYKQFLEAEYTASSNQLIETKDTIGQINTQSRSQDQDSGKNISWLDSLRGDIDSMLDSMDIDKHVAALQTAAENLAEHTINLIVVFTVQTIIFPLFFLWLMVKLFKLVFNYRVIADG